MWRDPKVGRAPASLESPENRPTHPGNRPLHKMTATVPAPKGDRLLPELLPFLCLSERFFQHAVGTSAGSLSPRTNWSSLTSFEFDLPPLDQQRRIAEILWAVDETLQCWVWCHQQLQT